ncbi:MAG: shikimate kinase [Methanocellales archaeon]|nr:shikimate kinase [Methanocellales archaeon]
MSRMSQVVKGRASACGAGTIINAIATWKGSAFAVDLRTTAEVELDKDMKGVQGEIGGGGDTMLIERCAELVLKRFDYAGGAHIRTSSEIPIARGLKSSSAAANAAVMATLDALGEEMEPLETIRIGIKAAVDVGVTITGAFDDAAASFLGGIVVTDNRTQQLIKRVEMESDVLIFVPEEMAFTSDTNVERSRLLAPAVDIAYNLALEGEFEKAMTLNGILYCAALGFDPEIILRGLEAGASGVGLAGTGTAFTALVNKNKVNAVSRAWSDFNGKIIKTKINNDGVCR